MTVLLCLGVGGQQSSRVGSRLPWPLGSGSDSETTNRPLLLAYSSQGYSLLLPELPELPIDRSETTCPNSETNHSVATDGHDRE